MYELQPCRAVCWLDCKGSYTTQLITLVYLMWVYSLQSYFVQQNERESEMAIEEGEDVYVLKDPKYSE